MEKKEKTLFQNSYETDRTDGLPIHSASTEKLDSGKVARRKYPK